MSLENFKGRKDALESILRYMGNDPVEPMYYRTNVLIHSERVSCLVRALSSLMTELFGEVFDPELANLMAKTHDDTEIGNGDVTLIEKQNFSEEDWKIYRKGEIEALERQSESWPKYAGRYQYMHLIFRYMHRKGPTEKLVGLCDKLDGLNECKHEVFAGNRRFIEPVRNYEKTIAGMRKDDIIREIMDSGHPLFDLERNYSLEFVAERSRPHTIWSIMQKTPDPSYDFWKILSLYNLPSNVLLEKKA